MLSSVDVVIVGGGIAGLSCALSLKDENPHLNVVVLEGRDRVGGRTFSKTDPVHGRADLGGAYIGVTQDRVMALLKRFNLTLYDVYREGQSVALNGPNSTPKHYSGLIPPYSFPALVDLNTLLVSMDQLVQTIDVENPWLSPNARILDKQTVGGWVDSQGWTGEAKEAVLGAVHSLTCSSPYDISLLWWLWLVQSGGTLKMLMAIKDGAQEKKVTEGLAELSQRMAEHVACVRNNQTVRQIIWSETGARVVTQAGEEFACGHLVVAVPPALYNSISWFPSLPPEKMQLSQRMPMGSIIKTVTYYEKPFWRLLGLSGEAFDSSGTPVVYSVDDCKPDGSHPAIMGFVSAHAALKLQLGTLEQRKAAIAAHYRRVYGFSAEPIGYVEQNWNAEPLSGGCYMGVCPPGVLFAFGPHLRTTVGRVHFAGTETAVRWSGYADGAVESGQRCAAEVAGKKFDWRVRPAAGLQNEPLGFTSLERRLPKFRTIVVSLGVLVCGALAVLIFK